MIFVTVGAQTPFDRLVDTVDAWAAVNPGVDVLAQIARADRPPRALRWVRFLDAAEARQVMHTADVIVTHAGMGTILTALEFGRPVLAMPRRSALRETRNDHQVGTARAFAATGQITVAWDETQLAMALDELDTLVAPLPIASHASPDLLAAVRQFITGQDERRPESPIAPAAIEPIRRAA